MIFQGIEDQAPEPKSSHINILALTYIINSCAINMIPCILTHTTLFQWWLLLVAVMTNVPCSAEDLVKVKAAVRSDTLALYPPYLYNLNTHTSSLTIHFHYLSFFHTQTDRYNYADADFLIL